MGQAPRPHDSPGPAATARASRARYRRHACGRSPGAAWWGGAPAGRTGAQHPRPPAAPQGQALTRDVPYKSNDTGTVNPGMSEREIYEVWAAPAAVRRVGQYTYLFYQNGCEYTCGTMDVVTLKDGRVVDAIVRWDGHRYSGESSSPPGRVPFPNPGGDTLHIAPPPAPPPVPPRQ